MNADVVLRILADAELDRQRRLSKAADLSPTQRLAAQNRARVLEFELQ